MKSKMKRAIALFVCLMLTATTLCTSAYAIGRDLTVEENLAGVLKTLGLFKGVSETDFALERTPTRTEALVMLVRLLDKEDEALGGSWSHPFTDVVAWADPYVGYAYQNGLTNGVSPTEFGTGNANAAMYVTFVLRALGYSDKNGEDFTWNDPFDLAVRSEIMPVATDLDNFLRADVVLVSYAALNAQMKGSEQILAEKLWSGNDLATYRQQYDEEAVTLKQSPIDIVAAYVVEHGKYDKKLKCYYLQDKDHYLDYYPDEACLRWRMNGVHLSGLLKNIEVPYTVVVTIADTSGVYETFGVFSTGEPCMATVNAHEYNGLNVFGNWYETTSDPDNMGRYFNVYTLMTIEGIWDLMEDHNLPVTPADFGFDNPELAK